jgi:hypothetical protein
MASNSFVLKADGQLGTSAADLVTVTDLPTGWEGIVQKVTLCNPTSSSVTGVYLYLSGDGSAAADDNTIMANRTIDAYDTLSVPIAGHVMPSGAKIMGKAGTATAITYHISITRKVI